MTLEENIKAILECNFSIAREEVIESAKTRIMEQISRQNPLEEELEKIKAEISDYAVVDDSKSIKRGFEIMQGTALELLDNHISELKGENNVDT